MKPKSGEIERKKILMSQQLRTMLEEGVYLPGAPLPGERTLAQQYGMNRMSVKAVLQELAEDGYIRWQGREYEVLSAQPVYLGGAVQHWWGLLRQREAELV